MRKYLWCTILAVAGVTGLSFLAAGYALRHPETIPGKLAYLYLRFTAPHVSQPAQAMCEPAACQAGRGVANVVAGAPVQRNVAAQTPVQAELNLLEVLEPIIIEPPVAVPQQTEGGRSGRQPGVEECELPVVEAAAEVLPAVPVRMPLADEELPATGCGCVFRQTAESVLRSCCSALFPGCGAWLNKAFMGLTATTPGANEESEKLDPPQPQPQSDQRHDSFRDPHRMYCPYTGRCPAPYHQFRHAEIPPLPSVPVPPADVSPVDMPPADGSTEEPDGGNVREVLPEPQREDREQIFSFWIRLFR